MQPKMHVGSSTSWYKYLAKLPTDKFRTRLTKSKVRFESRKSRGWSVQRYGSYYQLELVHKPTAAELAFGNLLCNLNLIPFEFQKQILKPRLFILDFYLPRRFVAFEIDGSSHKDKVIKDAERDRILLEDRLIKTYRFTNDEVLRNSPNLVDRVQKALSWE